MNKFVNPSITETAFNCPMCGTYTQQFWHETKMNEIQGESKTPFILTLETIDNFLNSQKSRKEEEQASEAIQKKWKRLRASILKNAPAVEKADCKFSSHWDVQNVFFSKCFNCTEISIWHGNKLIHPAQEKNIFMNPDMPEPAMADFEEARSIVDRSPRGAAALLRLCIEKICISLNCKGDLNAMIGQLVERGLSAKIQQALDTVRVVGGQAVHPLQMDLKDDYDTAMSLFRIVNIIITQMVSEQKEISEIYANLPPSKIEAIKKRDEA